MNEIRTAVNLVPIIVIKNGGNLSYTFTRSNQNAVVVFTLSQPTVPQYSRWFSFNGEVVNDEGFIRDGLGMGHAPAYIKLSVNRGDTVQWIQENGVDAGWCIIY